jgi:hypothetical protein
MREDQDMAHMFIAIVYDTTIPMSITPYHGPGRAVTYHVLRSAANLLFITGKGYEYPMYVCPSWMIGEIPSTAIDAYLNQEEDALRIVEDMVGTQIRWSTAYDANRQMLILTPFYKM